MHRRMPSPTLTRGLARSLFQPHEARGVKTCGVHKNDSQVRIARPGLPAVSVEPRVRESTPPPGTQQEGEVRKGEMRRGEVRRGEARRGVAGWVSGLQPNMATTLSSILCTDNICEFCEGFIWAKG